MSPPTSFFFDQAANIDVPEQSPMVSEQGLDLAIDDSAVLSSDPLFAGGTVASGQDDPPDDSGLDEIQKRLGDAYNEQNSPDPLPSGGDDNNDPGGVYASPDAPYHLCKDADAIIRDPKDHGIKTGESIPKGALCQVAKTEGKYCLVEYQIGGQKRSVWTRSSNLSKMSGDKKEEARKKAEAEAGAGSGFFCTSKGASMLGEDLKPVRPLPPGAIGRFVGVWRPAGKGSKTYARVEVTENGATHAGLVELSKLDGGGPIDKATFEEKAKARRLMLAGQGGDYSAEEIAAAVDGAVSPEDQDISAYRDQRRAAVQQQGDGPLHTEALGEAYALYQGSLAPHAAAVEAQVYQMVYKQANAVAFAKPGEAVDATQVTAQQLADTRQRLLNRYGASYFIEQYNQEVHDHWEPKTHKYADDQEHKGIDGVFRKKNKEWRALKKNERKQKMQQWGVTRFFHDIFHFKLNEGTRLDEIEWLVESEDEISAFAQEGRAAISAEALAAGVPAPPPAPAAPAALTSLIDYKAQLLPHVDILDAGSLTVTDVKDRRGKKKKGKEYLAERVVEILPNIAEHEDAGKAHKLADKMGLSVDWTQTWDGGGAGGEDGGPAGYLTVLGLPGLMELDVPVYGDLAGGAVVKTVHLGDRLAWTGAVESRGGEPWVGVQVGDGVGWLQARYTNGASVSAEIKTRRADEAERAARVEAGVLDIGAEAEDKAAFVQPPAGLKAMGYHVLRSPSSGAPLYEDMFSDKAAGRLTPTPEQLLLQTGPGDSRRTEVLAGGAPRAVPSELLRPANTADLLMNTASLDAAQVRTVRKMLATDPSLKAERERREHYYLKLQRIGPADADNTTALTNRSDLVASLADALTSLGVPNPEPQHRFADTLELVRIEKGLAPGDVRGIVAALGVQAELAQPNAVVTHLRAGKAVLVDDGKRSWRIRSVDPNGTLTLIGASQITMPRVGLAAMRCTALGVPADVDGDLDALAAAQEGALLDAGSLEAQWTDIYASTSVRESDWYLNTVSAEDSERAATAGALKAALPTPEQAHLFAGSPDDKVLSIIDRLLDSSEAEVGGLPGGFVAARRFAEAWAGCAEGRQPLVQAITERLLADLRAHVGIVAARDPLKAVDLVERLDAAPPLLGKPLVDEPMRDILKYAYTRIDTTQDAPKADKPKVDKKAKTTRLPDQKPPPKIDTSGGVTIVEYKRFISRGKFKTEPWPGVAKVHSGDRVVLSFGNFQTTFRVASYQGVLGWQTVEGSQSVGGATLTNGTVDEQTLQGLGVDPSSARITQVRGSMETGSPVNGYDSQYISMAFNQLTFKDGKYGSNAMRMLYVTLYDEDGRVREGMGDLVSLLSQIGMTVVKKEKGCSFSLEDNAFLDEEGNPKTIGADDGWDGGDLQTLIDQGRVPGSEHTKDSTIIAKNKELLTESRNKAELALRFDMEKLVILSAVFADPRVRAGAGLYYKDHFIDDAAEDIRVNGHRLKQFPISEKVLGVATKVNNSSPVAGQALIPQYFYRVAKAHPDILTPAKWAGNEKRYNGLLLDCVLGKGSTDEKRRAAGATEQAAFSKELRDAMGQDASFTGAVCKVKVNGHPLEDFPIGQDAQKRCAGLYAMDATIGAAIIRDALSTVSTSPDRWNKWKNKDPDTWAVRKGAVNTRLKNLGKNWTSGSHSKQGRAQDWLLAAESLEASNGGGYFRDVAAWESGGTQYQDLHKLTDGSLQVPVPEDPPNNANANATEDQEPAFDIEDLLGLDKLLGKGADEPALSVNTDRPAEVQWAEANRVSFSVVYGAALREAMAGVRDPAREAQIQQAALKVEGMPALWARNPAPGDGLALLWQLKRLCDVSGVPAVGDQVDQYLLDLEAAAGHERTSAGAMMLGAANITAPALREDLYKTWDNDGDKGFVLDIDFSKQTSKAGCYDQSSLLSRQWAKKRGATKEVPENGEWFQGKTQGFILAEGAGYGSDNKRRGTNYRHWDTEKRREELGNEDFQKYQEFEDQGVGGEVKLKDEGEAVGAIEYIRAELAEGYPVVVGVTYEGHQAYNDGVTDHFVPIIGHGQDGQGEYFVFHEVASKTGDGRDAGSRNRFYVDGVKLIRYAKGGWEEKVAAGEAEWVDVPGVDGVNDIDTEEFSADHDRYESLGWRYRPGVRDTATNDVTYLGLHGGRYTVTQVRRNRKRTQD